MQCSASRDVRAGGVDRWSKSWRKTEKNKLSDSAQGASKTAQGASKSRGLRDGPSCLQVKRTPRGPKEDPTTAQTNSRGPQHGPKGLQAKRTPRRPKRPPSQEAIRGL
eukprot:3033840-Pyramimonas_sp.AAC.1